MGVMRVGGWCEGGSRQEAGACWADMWQFGRRHMVKGDMGLIYWYLEDPLSGVGSLAGWKISTLTLTQPRPHPKPHRFTPPVLIPTWCASSRFQECFKKQILQLDMHLTKRFFLFKLGLYPYFVPFSPFCPFLHFIHSSELIIREKVSSSGSQVVSSTYQVKQKWLQVKSRLIW